VLEDRWLQAATAPAGRTLDLELRDLLTLAGRVAAPGLEGHAARVGTIARATARAAAWKEEDVEELPLHGALHDIGKAGVDPLILAKPGSLTPEEKRSVERHAAIGYRLLASRVPLLRRAARVAWQHHERWDGTGYPRGLAGKQIDRRARLVAIADVYDALTSTRPYRPALTPEEALQIMRAGRESHFDPHLLDAFVQAWTLAKGQWECVAG
jgi:putative two-component system response regulator